MKYKKHGRLRSDRAYFLIFYSEYTGERQVSLKLALDMAGIDFSGREHDALDDT